MELYHLFNSFCQLRRSKRITSKQLDVYFFLIHECNEKRWENPFECSNKLICGSIEISEQTLIDTRNRLKQLGLIDFVAGKAKKQSPLYKILYSNNWSINRGKTTVKTTVEDEDKVPPFNKTKQRQEENSSASNEAGAGEKFSFKNEVFEERKKPSAAKKKESVPPTPHWAALTGCWATFYQEHYGEKPTFNGAAVKALQFISRRLERLATGKGHEWSADYATQVLHHFLIKSHADSWRQKNFMLHILAAHFDAIIQHDENSTNNTKRNNRSGFYDDTAAVFAAIDACLIDVERGAPDAKMELITLTSELMPGGTPAFANVRYYPTIAQLIVGGGNCFPHWHAILYYRAF